MIRVLAGIVGGRPGGGNQRAGGRGDVARAGAGGQPGPVRAGRALAGPGGRAGAGAGGGGPQCKRVVAAGG